MVVVDGLHGKYPESAFSLLHRIKAQNGPIHQDKVQKRLGQIIEFDCSGSRGPFHWKT